MRSGQPVQSGLLIDSNSIRTRSHKPEILNILNFLVTNSSDYGPVLTGYSADIAHRDVQSSAEETPLGMSQN